MSLTYDCQARSHARQISRLLHLLSCDQQRAKQYRKHVARIGRSTKTIDEVISVRGEIIRQVHVLRGDKEYWGQKTWRHK